MPRKKTSKPKTPSRIEIPQGLGPGIFGKRPAGEMPVDSVAEKLGVKPHVLAGLKVECGWDSETKVTESEFLERLNDWLGQSQGV